jgi:hypothetical protein
MRDAFVIGLLVLLALIFVHRDERPPRLVIEAAAVGMVQPATFVDQCGKAQPDLLDPRPKDMGDVVVRSRNGGIA